MPLADCDNHTSNKDRAGGCNYLSSPGCNLKYKANVIFIVDSSSSIGTKNFKKLKAFLINVVRAFKVIGKDGVQVSLTFLIIYVCPDF
jgi:hypothetical protein